MNNADFKAQIKHGLEKLNREQQVRFAWRCAMRALPCLGYQGHFYFWAKQDRVRHLYSVMYALDTAYADYTDMDLSDVYIASSAADTAAIASTSSPASNIASRIAHATFFTVDVDVHIVINITRAVKRYGLTIDALILQDLQGANNTVSIEFYGDIWSNFQVALEKEDCGYWGQLYQTLFENNFQIDLKALENRLNVPKEIRAQGAAGVAVYLEGLEQGATQLNEARIIILGDKGAGKTCLARRLIDPNAPMTTEAESTAGVDTTRWQLDGDNTNVRIWDFAGHTVTHAVHRFFLSERCLYLMVYNARTEEKGSLECWLNHMQNYGGNSEAIILVNKRDKHSVDIKANFLKEKYPIAGIYYFSIAEDTDALECFRQAVAESIRTNPSWENQVIPSNYYQVKAELESLFSKGQQERITRIEFDQIAEKNQVEDKEHLLDSLHCLGISLWYKEMADFNTLVLNPEWISQGVYKIINWVNESKQYGLTLSDFTAVFKEDAARYPTDQHPFLFELMQRYELAYKTDAGNQLIIPHLLKEDRPKVLPDFAIGDSLMLRYKAEQPLPANTISRFIVRHHQQIKKPPSENAVWRYGVILEDGKGSLALVREEDRTISVSVKGRDKTLFIAELRETLNDIFNSYQSDKPELQYRIERYGEIPNEQLEAKYPVWLPDRQVLKQSNANIPYYDADGGQSLNLHPAVHNYQINTNNLIIGGQGHQVLADNSTHNTFNFYDCNIGLQGDLNDLAQLLSECGNEQEAEELKNTAKLLEQLEQCKTPEEVKKKGLASRLQRLMQELGDETSSLGQKVKIVKDGVKIAQNIAKKYNSIVKWGEEIASLLSL